MIQQEVHYNNTYITNSTLLSRTYRHFNLLHNIYNNYIYNYNLQLNKLFSYKVTFTNYNIIIYNTLEKIGLRKEFKERNIGKFY